MGRPDSEGSMFVWAPLPEGYTNSEDFTVKLMEKSGVIVTPGSSFGSLGEGYVRFALVLPCEELEKAVAAIAASGLIGNASSGSREEEQDPQTIKEDRE